MSTYVILGQGDAGAAATLHAAAFDTGWSPQAFRQLFAAPSTLAIGLQLDEVLIGFVSVQCVAGEADMHTIAIAPAHRRKGYARDLLVTLEKHLGARGISRITLDVAADNAEGTGLYTAFGYTEDGRRKAYYKRPSGLAADAILMSKSLGLKT